MTYTRLFDPSEQAVPRPASERSAAVGDRADASVYWYSEEVTLAVNVAMATGRPLLVRGPSGCGKSRLAYGVANILGWRLYVAVMDSRTEATDLLWKFDHLRRLHAAQQKVESVAESELEVERYISPGILWWAFDRGSAELQFGRGGGGERYEQNRFTDSPRAVVLIDEIDKADPDLPNNLLIPLGSFEFRVVPLSQPVNCNSDTAPLIFITSNDERDLPVAFVRRCVEVVVSTPDRDQLMKIAQMHFPREKKKFLEGLLDIVEQSRAATQEKRSLPVTAEFLDTVRAVQKLKISSVDDAIISDVVKMVIRKPSQSAR